MRFLSLFFSLILFAASVHAVTFGIDEAAAHAVRNSPSLAAARLRIEEARGRLQQAGRLANPELEGSFAQSFRTRERTAELGLVQKFPVTARLRLEKQVSRAELAAAEAEVRDEERRLAAAVRTAAVKLLAAGEQRALRERQLANSRQLADFTRKRAETAEASATDATLVALEARQLEAELLQLEVERVTLAGELRGLLGLAPAEPVGIRGELAAPLRLPPHGAVETARPDFQGAQANADAARATARLARAQRWEDIGIGLAVQSEYAEDAPDGFERDEFAGVRFSLPLPLWNDRAGRIREADAAAARREKEAGALAVTIRAEAGAARAEMETLARLLAAFADTLLPAAAQVEEQLRAAQSAGQAPLSEVLRARDRRLLLERQRIDALRDFHLARVRHDAATARGLKSSARSASAK